MIAHPSAVLFDWLRLQKARLCQHTCSPRAHALARVRARTPYLSAWLDCER